MILEKNLYGLEIDDRAAQLAAFVLMMKARAHDRRIFDAEVKLNVMAIQDSKGLDAEEVSNHVVITADHGFLFRELAPDETDKSRLEEKPVDTVKAKKRYLLGHNLGDHEVVWHGSTAITAGAQGDLEFWVPRGANRFHFVGGARFVHGGAMPQEICVPVVTVKHRKGDAVKGTSTKKVTVHILGSNHKITTARHRFEMIQMEAGSGRVKPSTLKVAVYEGGEPVTGIETVTFESSSGDLEQRKKTVILELRDRQYDKKKKCWLVLRDAETDVEQQSVDVVIDRAFTDDF